MGRFVRNHPVTVTTTAKGPVNEWSSILGESHYRKWRAVKAYRDLEVRSVQIQNSALDWGTRSSHTHCRQRTSDCFLRPQSGVSRYLSDKVVTFTSDARRNWHHFIVDSTARRHSVTWRWLHMTNSAVRFGLPVDRSNSHKKKYNLTEHDSLSKSIKKPYLIQYRES
jgi:hypothetical protein